MSHDKALNLIQKTPIWLNEYLQTRKWPKITHLWLSTKQKHLEVMKTVLSSGQIWTVIIKSFEQSTELKRARIKAYFYCLFDHRLLYILFTNQNIKIYPSTCGI